MLPVHIVSEHEGPFLLHPPEDPPDAQYGWIQDIYNILSGKLRTVKNTKNEQKTGFLCFTRQKSSV